MKRLPANPDGSLSKKARLAQPPLTAEELTHLKETENLFKSSLFRMQISELLSEVNVEDKKKVKITSYVERVVAALESIEAGEKTTVCDTSWLGDVILPLPSSAAGKAKGVFKALPPQSVQVCASWAQGACIKPSVNVDIAVQLPKMFVEPQDAVNARYLRKRSLYLCHIANVLKTADLLDGGATFACQHGDQLRPVMVLRPKGLAACIKVHVCLEQGSFKLARCHVDVSNLRPAWRGIETTEGASPPPTPVYNSAILRDLLLLSHHHSVQSCLQDSQGIREGLQLAKVWLSQRRLRISGALLSMVAVHLRHSRRLGPLMSSYQVFRHLLCYLSSCEWHGAGDAVCPAQEDGAPSLTQLRAHFPVVFADPSGFLNLASHVSLSCYHRLRHEAALALTHLDAVGVNSFSAIFMTPVSFLAKFDQVCHINLSSDGVTQCASKLFGSQTLLDCDGDITAVILPKLYECLVRALGERVKLVYVQPQDVCEWSPFKPPPELTSFSVSIGVLLDPQHASSLVDKGPAADSGEATEFREFWGEKSELRRFQDGSICEAAFWPAQTAVQRRQICGQVMKHVLLRHADIPREAVTVVSTQAECVLKMAKRKGQTVSYGVGEAALARAVCGVDELGRTVRGLSALPLAVHSVVGVGEVSRHSQVFPPLLTQSDKTPGAVCHAYLPSVAVLCTLESSGKWPDDAAAVRRMRAAFHVKMAQLLRDEAHLLAEATPDHVIVHQVGVVYRLKVGHQKEVGLLRLVPTTEGKITVKDTPASLDCDWQINVLPKMTSSISSVNSEHPSFSGCVRLCKRWVSAHMLLRHVPSVAVELLVANLYVHPQPFMPPAGPQVGLLRFVQFVARHDWTAQPVIVNFQQSLNAAQLADIHSDFTSNRCTRPLMYVATPMDPASRVTHSTPSPLVLQRLVLLARSAQLTLETQMADTARDVDWRHAFRPPLDHYDLLVHFDVRALPTAYQAVDVQRGARVPLVAEEAAPARTMPPVDFNPAHCLLEELQASFGDVALFFYDDCGGDVIGVLWKPAFLQPHPFKMSQASRCEAHVSVEAGVQLRPNMAAIIEDIRVMGQGLVTDIVPRGQCD